MQKPTILNSRSVARSRLFHIEELELEFSNGARRTYERINPERPQAVMIVAIDEQNQLLLVREYGAGLDDYYLSLPKGALEHDEAATVAGNRELMEEAGFGSNKMTILSMLSLSPSYLGNEITILLAEELYPKRLPGDEPEELEVVWWPMSNLSELLCCDDFTEAYAVAALFLAKEFLAARDAGETRVVQFLNPND